MKQLRLLGPSTNQKTLNPKPQTTPVAHGSINKKKRETHFVVLRPCPSPAFSAHALRFRSHTVSVCWASYDHHTLGQRNPQRSHVAMSRPLFAPFGLLVPLPRFRNTALSSKRFEMVPWIPPVPPVASLRTLSLLHHKGAESHCCIQTVLTTSRKSKNHGKITGPPLFVG